jgi:hypothetical protein
MESKDTWHYSEYEDGEWFDGNFPEGAEWYIFSRSKWECNKALGYNLVHNCTGQRKPYSSVRPNEQRCDQCQTVVPEHIKMMASIIGG